MESEKNEGKISVLVESEAYVGSVARLAYIRVDEASGKCKLQIGIGKIVLGQLAHVNEEQKSGI